MSYILDALRKADQQRQRGAAPTLLTVQATAAAPGKPALSLNTWWLAAALVVAGIVIGWLRPWQTEPRVPAAEPLAAQPRAPGTSPAAPVPPSEPALAPASTPAQALPETAGKTGQPPPAQLSAPAAPSATGSAGAAIGQASAPARIEAPPIPPGSVTIVPPETTSAMPEKPAGAGPGDAGQDKVLAMSELPSSIRQEISSLTISFHFYAVNPAERRIMINNELLRQGEVLQPGLRVEQITRDGVILGYKGYRFRLGVR